MPIAYCLMLDSKQNKTNVYLLKKKKKKKNFIEVEKSILFFRRTDMGCNYLICIYINIIVCIGQGHLHHDDKIAGLQI